LDTLPIIMTIGVLISSPTISSSLDMLFLMRLKDREGNQRGGGVNRSLIKFFYNNLTYVPCSKLQAKTMKESDEKH
jgi:hypothetical protein